MKPKLLDLFCGAGGCSVGYSRAGFDVIGGDRTPHPDYPFFFVEGDWEKVLGWVDLSKVAAITASPPCPRYSTATPAHTRGEHPDLIGPVREALEATGLPYVIENVMGAKSELRSPVMLCGSMFGLATQRHRLFEANFDLLVPECDHKSQGQTYGVYGQHGDKNGPVKRPNGSSRGVKARDAEHAREVLGIDWMREWHDLADAIPPAYTEHIGRQLMQVVTEGGIAA